MRKLVARLALFIGAIVISIQAWPQEEMSDTTWYDGDWQRCSATHAEYYRVQRMNDSGSTEEDHYCSGMLIRSESSHVDSSGNCVTMLRLFDDSCRVTRTVTYNGEWTDGPAAEYWENGRIRLQGNLRYDRREGTWMAYFPSGKLAGMAEFHEGKQTALRLYHEDGSLNRQDTIFSRHAEFPGGLVLYQQFLNNAYRYPDSAGFYGIQGTVVVAFKVLKNGKVADAYVIKSISKDLDDEALRVIRSMPDWKPAILAGVPYDSHERQPVVFRLP